jgi:hypothetical protein
MASGFRDALLQQREHSAAARRRTRQRWRVGLGLVAMGCGYLLLAISPDTPSEWLMPRVVLGFVCLLGGAGAALSPLLERLLQQ